MTWLIVGAAVLYYLWASRYMASHLLKQIWHPDGGDVFFCSAMGLCVGMFVSPFLMLGAVTKNKTRKPIHQHVHRLIIGKKAWKERYR